MTAVVLAAWAFVVMGTSKEAERFLRIFNGIDLTGWHMMGHQDWHVENGILWAEGRGGRNIVRRVTHGALVQCPKRLL
jgi:hypothetical protein